MLKERGHAVVKLSNLSSIEPKKVDLTQYTTVEQIRASREPPSGHNGHWLSHLLAGDKLARVPNAAFAHADLQIRVHVDYDEDAPGMVGRVYPDRLFWSDEELNVCIIGWTPPDDDVEAARLEIDADATQAQEQARQAEAEPQEAEQRRSEQEPTNIVTDEQQEKEAAAGDDAAEADATAEDVAGTCCSCEFSPVDSPVGGDSSPGRGSLTTHHRASGRRAQDAQHARM